jgi:hypothetical protein
MQFTFREITLDVALVILAALVWFYTDRAAVHDAFQSALGTVLGLF